MDEELQRMLARRMPQTFRLGDTVRLCPVRLFRSQAKSKALTKVKHSSK